MSRSGMVLTFLSLFVFVSLSAIGQKNDSKSAAPAKQEQKKKEDKKKESKEDKAKAESRKKEAEGNELKKWLEEDVAYIITGPEEAAFKLLGKDEERETFIEQFWARRDPSPETLENEYRDQYYARIAYANEHYASGAPGWRTDRGRIYIMHGPPDQKETHPISGTNYRRPEEGGGLTAFFPYEIWWYRNIDGVGTDVELEFVDPSSSGEYRLTYDCSEKDAFKNVPDLGFTQAEVGAGIRDKSYRVDANNSNLGGPMSTPCKFDTFDRLRQFNDVLTPPEVKFKDLETIVNLKKSFNQLTFAVRSDYVKVTDQNVWTPLTVQVSHKDLSFKRQPTGEYRAEINFHGKITDGLGKIVGRPFEQTGYISVTEDEMQNLKEMRYVYQTTPALRPGRYIIDMAVRDVNSGNTGTVRQLLLVPKFASTGLATSSLVLADLMQPISPTEVGGGQFIIGGTKVRPSVKNEFRREQNLNIWTQVYNLKMSETTHKPSATIEILISRGNEEVKRFVEESSELPNAAEQITVGRTVSLEDFEPGQYSVQVKITDNLTNDVVTVPGKFSVR